MKLKTVIILFLLLLYPLSCVDYIVNDFYVTNIKLYKKCRNRFTDYSVIFPENLNNIKKVNKFIFGSMFFDQDLLFLESVYNEREFLIEEERLKNVIHENRFYSKPSDSDYGKYKKLQYCGDGFLFDYPTYVADYQVSKFTYEYASLDKENLTIAYVKIDMYETDKFEFLDDLKKWMPKYWLNDQYKYTVYSRYPDYTFEDWYTNNK